MLDAHLGTIVIVAGSAIYLAKCLRVNFKTLIYLVYLSALGLSSGMRTHSCGMWDLVP